MLWYSLNIFKINKGIGTVNGRYWLTSDFFLFLETRDLLEVLGFELFVDWCVLGSIAHGSIIVACWLFLLIAGTVAQLWEASICSTSSSSLDPPAVRTPSMSRVAPPKWRSVPSSARSLVFSPPCAAKDKARLFVQQLIEGPTLTSLISPCFQLRKDFLLVLLLPVWTGSSDERRGAAEVGTGTLGKIAGLV